MKCLDPTALSPAERLAELGELLAAAVQRFLATQRKGIRVAGDVEEQLDDRARVEAPCGSNSMEAE